MNDSKGLVSVIITTRNRCKLLRRAIESVVNQTYKDIEIVVVDDFSTDNTRMVCEAYSVKYVYISKSESRGGNHARNVGISSSTGIYIAFLDDDDYWMPTKIQRQVALMESSDCSFVYCGMCIEDVQENGNVTISAKRLNKRLRGNLSKRIFVTICTTTSCIMIKRALVDDIGTFDENLGFWQEYELIVRAAQKTDILFVDEHLVVYRNDRFDKCRLTNKYYEWLKAAEYVECKHRQLIEKMTLAYTLLHKTLLYRERYNRAVKSGLNGIALINLFKFSLLYTPYFVYDRLKEIFGCTYIGR